MSRPPLALDEQLATSAGGPRSLGAISLAAEPGEQPPQTSNTFSRIPTTAHRLAGWFDTLWQWLFGGATLFVGLAVLATLPGLQFLSLGYLLEVSGRVARTGRLSAGIIGLAKAARVGGVVLGMWLLLWPLRFTSLMASSARLIDPGGTADRIWTTALWIFTPLFVLHVVGACLRGGRLRSFFWPRPLLLWRQLRAPGAFERARDALWEFVVELRLPYYFWLGLRGFVGALSWLIVPVSLLAAGRAAPAVGWVGGLLLFVVVLYLPFLQTRFAAENRLRAMYDVRAVRREFCRAPLWFLLALWATLLLAAPLYLLKIELIPREAAWLPSLLFVGFMGPARLLTGYAVARARARTTDRHKLIRLPARLALVPAAVLYVLFVYFSQFTSWYGVASLYEQHAFLVPVPFLEF